jgi:hypothetical protein
MTSIKLGFHYYYYPANFKARNQSRLVLSPLRLQRVEAVPWNTMTAFASEHASSWKKMTAYFLKSITDSE